MRKPLRTPKSSAGSTSGRPSLKMSSISTVQRPTPRTAVSRAMISSSGIARMAREVGIVPSSVFAAMSRMAAIFARENPQPRSASSLTLASRSAAGNRLPETNAR